MTLMMVELGVLRRLFEFVIITNAAIILMGACGVVFIAWGLVKLLARQRWIASDERFGRAVNIVSRLTNVAVAVSTMIVIGWFFYVFCLLLYIFI